MTLEQIIDFIKDSPDIFSNIAHWKTFPPKNAHYGDFPAFINPKLQETLTKRGINQLYSHQHDAIEAIIREENVVIVTPTASGKTLCYNLPVLNKIMSDDSSRALYLFPTKAL